MAAKATKKTAKRAPKKKAEAKTAAAPKKKVARKKPPRKTATVIEGDEIEDEIPGGQACMPGTPPPPPPVEAIPDTVSATMLAELQAAPQSPGEVEPVQRMLVTLPQSLYDRLRLIAEAENRNFSEDEDLTLAQQAAMMIEAGVALWEQDDEDPRYVDSLNEDPDYAEALQTQCTGAIAPGRGAH